jgi:alkylation response protein AidB-like acyl-CoA dehydrogenase
MDLDFTQEEIAFRGHIREWLQRNLQTFGHFEKTFSERRDLAYRRAWEDHMCREGWACISWPKAFGGREMSPMSQLIFHEEYARAGAPMSLNSLGQGILGPTLIVYGSEGQKKRFLPGILKNHEIWCQGYSEPNAGSDLASLKTRAVRQNDRYIVNGQKIWTSLAHIADWCFLLVRTNTEAPKHKGITFLLVDMKSQGITVKPIRQMTGESEFCEVFFDNVEVPVEMRVGEEDEGWKAAMAAANFERGTLFIPRQVEVQRDVLELISIARKRGLEGRKFIDDGHILRRLLDLLIRSKIMLLHSYRVVSELAEGEAPGPSASYTKLFWSETHQRVTELAMELLAAPAGGNAGFMKAEDQRWILDYLRMRAITILAGTSEIQRNIIAERALGLPR